MFETLARRVSRHPRRTIVVWAVVTVVGFLVALTGVGGASLFDRLASGNPAVPGSESERGAEILAEHGTAGETVTMIVSGVDPTSEALPGIMATIVAEASAIDGVASVIDPFQLPGGVTSPAAAPLLSSAGDGFIVVAELATDLDEDEQAIAVGAVAAAFDDARATLATAAPDVRTLVGANRLILDAVTDQVQEDLKTGELVALPVALVIMVLVFGGFLAAAMPMVGAIASIGAGLGVLHLLTFLLDVDAAVVNVITLLSIGLSIDYGLLVVSRFREELTRAASAGESGAMRRRRGDGVVAVALTRTMTTAGRTVAFSAVTVAVSIAGLMAFRPDVLRAIGAAGLAIVLIAVATALTLVPAVLVLAGRRMERAGTLARIPGMARVLARTADVESDEGTFYRLAARVQRRPWWTLVASLAVLVLLALPLAHLQLRSSDIELLPTSNPQREFVTVLQEEYPASTGTDLVVVVDAPTEAAASLVPLIGAVDSVTRASEPTGLGPYSVIAVDIVGDDSSGREATTAVGEIRALDTDLTVWVTGPAAQQVDFVSALSARAWAAGAVVVLATFVLLFLMTGSVIVPLKALLTNALSLAAALGVLVWVFQDGHLESLLGFASTGGIETYVFAIVIAFAFGLAMDYEVFLIARIKELVDSGMDGDEAVRVGLQRSGRIITSAAAIIVVVFAGFVFGDLLVIKQVGFALAFAVALDATLVRMLLVPATMTLLGRHNWWCPPALRRVHERFGIIH